MTGTPRTPSRRGRLTRTAPGRPRAITEAQEREIAAAVTAGCPVEVAAVSAGVPASTFWRWMQLGREEAARVADGGRPDPTKADYLGLFHAVDDAVARSERRLVTMWSAAAQSDWRAARDLLARRFPERWAPRERREHTGVDGGPIQVAATTLAEARQAAAAKLAEVRQLHADLAPPQAG